VLPSAPRNDVERAICRCFAELLKIDDVGIDDDFFLLGGHSLLVVSLCERLSRTLDTRVGVVDIFEYPTARELGNALVARLAQRPGRHSAAAVSMTREVT
jgi:hypothetical protein